MAVSTWTTCCIDFLGTLVERPMSLPSRKKETASVVHSVTAVCLSVNLAGVLNSSWSSGLPG